MATSPRVAIEVVVKAAPFIGSKDKTVGWYDKTFTSVPDDAQELLQNYAHVPGDEVRDYVLAMRDQAWDIFPYPCIGQFRFLDLSLSHQPSYPKIVETLKGGGRYLDVGCCLGQDIRKLVYDGVPADSLVGAELEEPFIGLGYDLFKDRESLKTRLLQADIFDTEGPLKEFEGQMNFVHLGMVLHIFGWETQRTVLENCIKLLKSEPGVMIVGQAVGHLEGVESPAHHGTTSFKHSAETFKSLWEGINERTGLDFECRPSIDSGLSIGQAKRKWDDDKARRLVFEVERKS